MNWSMFMFVTHCKVIPRLLNLYSLTPISRALRAHPTATMVKLAQLPYSCKIHHPNLTDDRAMSTRALTYTCLPEDKNATDVRIYAITHIPKHDSWPRLRRISRNLKNPPQPPKPRKKSVCVSGNNTKSSAQIKQQ